MQVAYSELINKFQDVLGTPKPLIEETFNKSDVTDVVMDRYIAVKNFGDFYLLIVYEFDRSVVRFLNAYRIYPKLIDGADVSKMKPREILAEFMNRYGVSKPIPGFGEQKIFFDKKTKVFFPGILDIDKYLEAVKSI